MQSELGRAVGGAGECARCRCLGFALEKYLHEVAQMNTSTCFTAHCPWCSSQSPTPLWRHARSLNMQGLARLLPGQGPASPCSFFPQERFPA